MYVEPFVYERKHQSEKQVKKKPIIQKKIKEKPKKQVKQTVKHALPQKGSKKYMTFFKKEQAQPKLWSYPKYVNDSSDVFCRLRDNELAKIYMK